MAAETRSPDVLEITEFEDSVRWAFTFQVTRTEPCLVCPKCGNRSVLRQFGTSPALPGRQLCIDRCLHADCAAS